MRPQAEIEKELKDCKDLLKTYKLEAKVQGTRLFGYIWGLEYVLDTPKEYRSTQEHFPNVFGGKKNPNLLKEGDRVKLINPASAIAHCVPAEEAVLGRKGTVEVATDSDVRVVFDDYTGLQRSGWFFTSEELQILTPEEDTQK